MIHLQSIARHFTAMAFGLMAFAGEGMADTASGSARESTDAGKNYTLTIDGAETGINPGDTVEVTTPDGRTVTVTLARREYVTYESEFFSFEHTGRLSVGTSDLGGGILQHALISALGTVAIVQEYRGLDPSSFTPLVMQEMTKESEQAGATVSKKPTTRELNSGTTLEGSRARVATRYDALEIEVVAVGRVDHGVLVVTQIDEANREEDGAIIERFWDSLDIGF